MTYFSKIISHVPLLLLSLCKIFLTRWLVCMYTFLPTDFRFTVAQGNLHVISRKYTYPTTQYVADSQYHSIIIPFLRLRYFCPRDACLVDIVYSLLFIVHINLLQKYTDEKIVDNEAENMICLLTVSMS